MNNRNVENLKNREVEIEIEKLKNRKLEKLRNWGIEQLKYRKIKILKNDEKLKNRELGNQNIKKSKTSKIVGKKSRN